MDNGLNLFNNDQSYISGKLNSLYTLMFTVSLKTKINPLITCLLFLIEDIQLIYFITFDKSVISINETLRNLIGFMALDNVDFSTFTIITLIFCGIYFIASLLIVINVTFIKPEKVKENYSIKCIRWVVILFNSVLFPIFTHILIKAVIPKIGNYDAFPENETSFQSNNVLVMLLSVLTFIFYLLFQFLIFPFVYVNPTPFRKNNSLCQKYNFFGMIYNVLIFLLSIVIVIFQAFLEDAKKYVCIILGLGTYYLTTKIVNGQPYYNNCVNYLRAGTMLMITGMSIVNLISLIVGKSKSIFGILSPIIGICFLIIGVVICKLKYNRLVKGVYSRFKEKRISEKAIYKQEYGIDFSDSEKSEEEEKSQISSENEEKLISLDSGSEDEDYQKKKKRNEDSDSEEGESEEDEEYNSDNESYEISDRISERISSFNSIHEIVKETILNEPVIIYNNCQEFELACRFIRNNETSEAFRLIKELYDECIKQYIKDPYVFSYYAYYLMYIEERTSKMERDEIMGSINKQNKNIEKVDEEKEVYDENSEEEENEEEEEGKENNIEVIDEEKSNACDPNQILSKAFTCKLNVFSRYFINYLFYDIREKKKDDKDYYKKESIQRLVRLQHEAVEKHITLLNLLKKFFSYVRHSNSNNPEFSFDGFLEMFCSLKNKTLYLYKYIMENYPEEKSTYQLYTLFMKDVINSTDGDKYVLNEGDSFMALNSPDPNNDSKPIRRRGSAGSNDISDAGGSTINESEFRRKKLKNNIITVFTEQSRRYTRGIYIMFCAIAVLYIICIVYSIRHTSNFMSSVQSVQTLGDMDYYLKDVILNIRFYSFAIITKDTDYIETQRTKLQEGLDFINDNYMLFLKPYANAPKSSTQVIMYTSDIVDGDFESSFEYFNAFELMNNMCLWINEIINISPDEWIEKVDKGENILLDFRFKMFSDNSEAHFDDVICESIDSLYEDEITSKNKEIYIIYTLTFCIIALSLLINFFGITPIYINKKRLQNKTMGMFKLLLKGSINDLVSKFEIGVESITETYDISIDNKKNDISKIDNESTISRNLDKLKGYIINILLIGMILLMSIPIISKDKSIIKSLDYNLDMGERKDKVLDMTSFAFETLLQDVTKSVPGTQESLLYNKVKDLRRLQEKLYLGKLGLPSTTKMRELDDFIVNKNCKLDEEVCENIEDIPEIGFTKDIVMTGMNEMLDEMAASGMSIVQAARIENYRTSNVLYRKDFPSSEELGKRFTENVLGNSDFLFIYKMLDHSMAALLKSEAVLYNKMVASIKSTMIYLIYVILLDIVLYIVSFVTVYKSVKTTNKILDEMVNVIFIIPQSTINMIPQFKRFVETGSFEED